MSSTSSVGQTQTGLLTYEGTERYLDLDGIEIHYHEAGEHHDDVVVFLHGGGPGASGWFNFHRNIEPFAEHFRTILVDFPNYGRSAAWPVTEVDNARFNADVLARFLEAKGIARASLVGNSMGGACAVSFSVHHRDRLDLNVLMGVSVLPSIMSAALPQGVMALMSVMREPSREGVEELVRLMVHDPSFIDDDFVDLRWRAVQEAEERGHLTAMRASRKGWVNESANLPEVQNPALVVYGAHDRFAALDSSLALLRLYPNSELHVFRNCGHWVQFELADAFNDLTITWLLRQKGRVADRAG